jgi:hypothetical protein
MARAQRSLFLSEMTGDGHLVLVAHFYSLSRGETAKQQKLFDAWRETGDCRVALHKTFILHRVDKSEKQVASLKTPRSLKT